MNNGSDKVQKRITVFYDGNCPMCSALADMFSQLNTDGPIGFVDMHDTYRGSTAKERFTGKQLNDSMVVLMPDGSWRTGYFAIAEIFLRLRNFKAIGRIMLFPLLYGVGPAVYKLIAMNRQAISKFLLPKIYQCDDKCRI